MKINIHWSLFILFFIFFLRTSYAQELVLAEEFNSCPNAIPNGWNSISLTGNENWGCTLNGKTGSGIYMNGYNGGNYYSNEDWLISPPLLLSNYLDPKLTFWCRTKYIGNPIQILISTNYNGSGNPNNATWNNLTVNLPEENSDYWAKCESLSLGNYQNNICYIAFKYTSTTASASLWTLDELMIKDSLSREFINLGHTTVGQSGDIQTFEFMKPGVNVSLNLSTNYPFLLSKDGVNYAQDIAYDSSIVNMNQVVYVKMIPTEVDKIFHGQISFKSNLKKEGTTIWLLGSSIPNKNVLKIASWNMKWFGSPAFCDCDTGVTKKNAIKILTDLNADVYFLQEVVKNSQINDILAAMGPNYSGFVSPYCSGATNTSSSFYVNGQKLAFIYNTQKIQSLGHVGLLSSTYPNDTLPYYNFASGRFPLLMKGVVQTDNFQDTMYFVNIHAKAGDNASDYSKRENGCLTMTDSLNFLYSNRKICVVGDYNDYLEGSNYWGQQNNSPYQYLLNNNFTGISLPSLYPFKTTYIKNDNYLIDNVVYSNNIMPYAVDSGLIIFTEAQEYISNYHVQSSDHLPIMSYLNFDQVSGVNDKNTESEIQSYHLINPSFSELNLICSKQNHEDIEITIRNLEGQALYTTKRKTQLSIKVPIPNLSPGGYFVELRSPTKYEVYKWIVMN